MLITTANGDQLRGDRNINSLIQLLLEKLDKKLILSIGDSHSRLFSDLNAVKIFHIGPVTAFNLVKENSSTKGREKLHEILDTHSPSEVAILLSFGEIDIRAHVIKAAIKEGLSVKESAIRTASKYSKAISEIISRGFSVLVQGVHASGSTYDNQSFPAVGRVEDRNYAVKQFNEHIRTFCVSQLIPYASLDSLVINSDLKTNNEYMCDGCHLNFNPEIQAILIYQFLTSFDLGTDSYAHLKVADEMTDVSRNKPFTLTSSCDGQAQGIVSRREPYFFHTDLGSNQGILIDLQAKFIIDHIRIVNRVDCCQDRARSLCVCLFDRKDEIHRIDIPDHPVFLTSGGSIQIKIPEHLMPSRVSVFSKVNTYLHLSDINIYSCLPPME
jgi:hypothetical protein